MHKISKFLKCSSVSYVTFCVRERNRKYNGQCEQSFGKIERIAKQISDKRKNQEESGEIRWVEQPYHDILIKVDRGGLNGPTPGRIGLIRF